MPKTTLPAVCALAVVLLEAAGLLRSASAEKARVVPPPVDAPAAPGSSEVAVVAGGCFWGVQGVYQHVKGVKNAVSGYAGGDKESADYQRVGTGRTGHAESVQITFDPRVVSYGRLLQIFFSVAHDPTQLNRQGPDTGTQYRSTLFPTNAEQARIAKAYIDQLNQARVYDSPIATTIEPDRSFHPAEAYHQDFMDKNPLYPYIVINDRPKLNDLKRLFPEAYSAKPVLVGDSR